MVLIEAAKAFKKAEGLKEKIQAIDNCLRDNECWVLQQQLVESYRRVLVLDLEYALDKKVEQDLWIFAFKSFIGKLQAIVKDKKNSKRAEGQAMLHWCLESATAFYLCLLNDVGSTFDLDLPFKRHDLFYGCTSLPQKEFPKDVKLNKNSCYYICQHCLVHLGDIARYKNQNRQAEIFYRHAVMLSPASGQPYNQLALLEASRGDKVSAVFHYMRAVALSHPFSAAATNLNRVLEIHSEDTVNMDGYSKLSSHEYLAAFLKLHGLLNSHAELEKADKLVQILTTSLTAHIATESLSSWKLVQMVAINIYAYQKVGGGEGQGSEKEMTATELRVKSLAAHFLAGCLNAFLLPVYTMNNEEPLLQYFALPAIKLTIDWIRLQPEVLKAAAFHTRRQIWPSLCCLLNQIKTIADDISLKKYDCVPLPEERDLQGFLPFEKTHKRFSFHTDDLTNNVGFLNKLRAARILEFGQWLAEYEPQLITKSHDNVFVPVGRPDPPGELLKEFEELSLAKVPRQNLSKNSIKDSPIADNICTSGQQSTEKKGILKSELPADKSNDSKGAKGKRNVALTSLMLQKTVEDIKQVTFRTPSPVKEKNSAKKTGGNINKGVDKLKTKKSKSDDFRLLQQHKLLEVLESASEDIGNGEAEVDPKKDKDPLTCEDTKQQVLSALFDNGNLNQQPQNMSGLLNLNKQQQQILSNSKSLQRPTPSTRPPPAPPSNSQLQPPRSHNSIRSNILPGQPRVVEKMEAARKEYEDAMFVLQQRKMEQPELLRYPGDSDSYRYDRMVLVPNPVPPQPQPSHLFVPLNQSMGMPMQNLQPFAFKMQPNMMGPWQEPEQQPPLPPSWWTDRMPPPSLVMQNRDVTNYRQPQLSTYSLFSNPMVGDTDSSVQVQGRLLNQQSFWSGPGPSPLERLLEQQRKQMRDTESNS